MFSLYGIHIVVFLTGILVIWLIRRKYRKITPMELTVIFVLYALLVLLYTEPVVSWIKSIPV